MTTIISGKDLASCRKAKLRLEIEESLVKYGRRPKLAVILVGNDAGSLSYVRGKAKAADEVGILVDTYHYEDDLTEDFLVNKIKALNADPEVDGILVQLPLPCQIRSDVIIELISPFKDVDGFHPRNVASLYLKHEGILPCTPKGVIALLDSANIEIDGKRAVVVGRSNIVGMPMSKMLLDRNATVTICHSHTKDLASVTSNADILIAALGKPRFIKAEMVKEGAAVIDVGCNRDSNNKLCGDVDFDNVAPKCSYITKVPGGVGPMTICCLMENTYIAYLNHMEGKN